MTTTKNLEQLEEFAFYESGLSADGCIEKLDYYTNEAIKKYGRYLLNRLEEDLREADLEYIKLVKQLTKLEEENKDFEQRLNDIKEGFEGCCYACEPVGILNQELESQNEKWKDVAKKLYSVVLHLQAVANDKPIIVVGDGLYSESVYAIKAYEDLHGN